MRTSAHVQTKYAGLAHQFEDLAQQHDADYARDLGIPCNGDHVFWRCVCRVCDFSLALFCRVCRREPPSGYPPRRDQHVVLLGSSLTMALSVRSAQIGNRRTLVFFLLLTMILGGAFLGVKAYEYHQKFVEHIVPSLDWAPRRRCSSAPGARRARSPLNFISFSTLP